MDMGHFLEIHLRKSSIATSDKAFLEQKSANPSMEFYDVIAEKKEILSGMPQNRGAGVTVEVHFLRLMECWIHSTQRRTPGTVVQPEEIKDVVENGL